MKILHVFTDNKFFDPISSRFDRYLNVDNVYLFYSSKENYEFKYIKNTQKVSVVNKYKEYTSYFSAKDIDVIYFHALYYKSYLLFKYIDSTKIVVWWAWGFDLYEKFMGLPPIIKIDTLKPLTKKYEENFTVRKLVKSIYYFSIKKRLQKLQRRVLQRVDYVQTVLPIEFDLLNKNKNLDVKYFAINENSLNYASKPKAHENAGNILLGNSATLTNNHMDVLEAFCINNICLEGERTVYFPLSYGDRCYKHYLVDFISRNFACRFEMLHEFIARDEYSNIIRTVTHAVFGHIRQQAMWNVFSCINNGCKLFFFSDSIIYLQLIRIGFKVFTIENDLVRELNSPLSSHEVAHNYDLLFKMKSEKKDTILELLREINEKIVPVL